jgi:FtsH-binding integral membrane protein
MMRGVPKVTPVTPAKRVLMNPLRNFSNSIKPPTVNNSAGMLLMGGALAGMGYLTYSSMQLKANQAAATQKGETFMSPLVQKRVSQTLSYFGFGLGLTGLVAYGLRNSAAAMNLHWGVCLAGMLGFQIATRSCDYNTQYPAKMACYLGFLGMVGVTIMPLCVMAGGSLVIDAALATGVAMSTLAGVAYMAPSEQFLQWGGALGMACGGMFAVSLMCMFSNSAALWNVWLYGGLLLNGVLVMYQTQKIIHNAKTLQRFDPIDNSLGIYIEAINIFQRILMILMGNKRR